MNKVINGKGYNTETAKELARYDNGLYPNDFEHYSETLYIKKTGEYFLHGEGGGNSKYGEWHGNSGGSGETIIPLTFKAAREWAEETLDGDEYEAIFGNVVETTESGEQQQQFSILIPLSVMDALKAKKEATGQSITALILKSLREAGYGE